MTSSSKRSCCSHTQLAGSWWRGDHQDQIPVDHPKRFLLRSSRICALLFPCIPYLSSHGRQLKKGGLQKFGSCQGPSVTHALAEDTRGSSGLAQRGGSVASWWHSGLSAFDLAALRSCFKHAGLPAQQHAWEKKNQNRSFKEAESISS